MCGSWPWLLVGIVAAHLLLTPFVGFAAAALQIVTPPQMRGKVSALFLFVISALGLGLGPSFVAAISDFVLHSQQQLGESLALFVLICAGLAIVLLAAARPRFRREVVSNEH
jgi:MFS family permease